MNDEARQLEYDRAMVGRLVATGDPLVKARKIDHWINLPTESASEELAQQLAELGFRNYSASTDALPFRLRLVRVDHVDLDRIHAVAMQLVSAAHQHGGEYEGWETIAQLD